MISESERLAELAAYDVLDTAAEPAFDDIVRVAAEASGCPTALVSLLDEDRQWFKARCGIDVGQTPRDQAFCEHALRADAPLIVADATADVRFRDNPLVTGTPGIRFYAGFPLRTPTGAVLGTLCVLGYEPRPEGLTSAQGRLLEVLAAQVMAQLELRRALAQQADTLSELGTALSSYRALADHATDIVSRHAVDGTTLYVSPSIRHLLGYDPDLEVGRAAPERVHPEDTAEMIRVLGGVLGGAPRPRTSAPDTPTVHGAAWRSGSRPCATRRASWCTSIRLPGTSRTGTSRRSGCGCPRSGSGCCSTRTRSARSSSRLRESSSG